MHIILTSARRGEMLQSCRLAAITSKEQNPYCEQSTIAQQSRDGEGDR